MSIVNEKDILSGIIIRDVPVKLSGIELATMMGSLNEIDDGKFAFVGKDKNGKYDDVVIEIADNCDCLDFEYSKIDNERGVLIFIGQDRISNERFIVIKKIFNAVSLNENEQKKSKFNFGKYDVCECYSKDDRFVVESSVRRVFDLSNIFCFDGRVFVVGANSGYEITFINFKDVYDNLDNEFLKALGFEFIEFNSDGETIKCKFTINGETFIDIVDARYFTSFETIINFFVDFSSNKIALNNKRCNEILGDKYKEPVLFITNSSYRRIFLDNNFGFGFISCNNPVGVISNEEMYNIFDLEEIYIEHKEIVEQRKCKISELGRYMRDVNVSSSNVVENSSVVDDVTLQIGDFDVAYLDRYGNCFLTLSSKSNSLLEYDDGYNKNSKLERGYKIIYGDMAIQELGRSNVSDFIDLSIEEVSLILNTLKKSRSKTGVFAKK